MINSSKNAKFEVSLKFVIKDKDGRILLLKMPDNSQMAGYYDLPGGRIQESEKTDNLKTIANLRKLFTKGPLESMTNYITGRFGECEA